MCKGDYEPAVSFVSVGAAGLLKSGTSGLRGFVEEKTDLGCLLYTRAFLRQA